VAGDYCTFSQGGWGNSNGTGGTILTSKFGTVYLSGVTVGLTCTASHFHMSFSSASAVFAYLPGNGTGDALDTCLANPTTSSSGEFGGQVLALQLSKDLSQAGDIGNHAIGGLLVCNTGFSAIDGKTINAVLGLANTALGNGGLPSGMAFSDLNTLVSNINLAFDNCNTVSSFATTNLRIGACSP
jgi:hypothetical protein